MDYNPKDLQSVLAYMRETFGAGVFEEPPRMFSILLDLAPGLERDGNVLRQMSTKGLLRELRTASESGAEYDRTRLTAKSRKWLIDYLMLSDDKADYFITALQAVYGLEMEPPEPKPKPKPIRKSKRKPTPQPIKPPKPPDPPQTQEDTRTPLQQWLDTLTPPKPEPPPTPQPKPKLQPPKPAIIDSGSTGDCTWTLDSNHVLTISGQGVMDDYKISHHMPWWDYRKSIKTAVIERGVTSIGSGAFWLCTALTSVTIPDSVTSIQKCAFASCFALTSVIIPDSVTSIGSMAFHGCIALTSVTIPDSMTFIGYMTFMSCKALTSVTIPASVTRIEQYAFKGCKSLNHVNVSKGTRIAPFAFEDYTQVIRR